MRWPGIYLSTDDTGEDVKTLQREIGAMVTGTFDVQTQTRLRGWQLARGLNPTGVYDYQTKETMEKS